MEIDKAGKIPIGFLASTAVKAAFTCLILVSATAWGAGRVSESDLFGGEAAAPATKNPGKTPVPTETPAPLPALKSFAENLQIGGSLSTEFDAFYSNGQRLKDNGYSNPNVLFIYLDSKFENDGRVFAKTRVFYDPTGVAGGSGGSSNLSNPYGSGSSNGDHLQVSLQELKLSTNLDRKVFLTVGRQKVKYGAAKYFNPTDFLNAQAYNFFLPSDERTGVDMVKVHLPSGTANLYAAGVIGNETSGTQTAGYARFEKGYDGGGKFLGSGEFSISGWFPRHQAGRAGFDLSQALGALDVYFEGAAGKNALGDWIAGFSTGLSWTFRYAERESNTLTLSGEFFEAGSLAQYGVLGFYLPTPGNLPHTTFVQTNLYNLDDRSGLSRLDVIQSFSEHLSGRVYVQGHWGPSGGTFRGVDQAAETGARLDVTF